MAVELVTVWLSPFADVVVAKRGMTSEEEDCVQYVKTFIEDILYSAVPLTSCVVSQ